MKNQTLLPPVAADQTEALLQGLIAECGAIIRDQLRPAMDDCDDPYRKCHYVQTAVSLVKIGARVGEAIGRLRNGASGESRQRITVERVQAIRHGEGG